MSNVSTPEPDSLADDKERKRRAYESQLPYASLREETIRLPYTGDQEEAIAQWRAAIKERRMDVLGDVHSTVVCTCRPGSCSGHTLTARSPAKPWSIHFATIAGQIIGSFLIGSAVALVVAAIIRATVFCVEWMF